VLPPGALLSLVLFTVLLLALSLHALAASGHFPREHRSAAFKTAAGTAILYGSIVTACVCLLAGLIAAWHLIPWYTAVIGGGLAILVAPLMLQQFSDRFIDGRASLLAFAGAACALALILIGLTARG
jgi:hypothetical protein